MEIKIDLNVNAPELCETLLVLASSMAQKNNSPEVETTEKTKAVITPQEPETIVEVIEDVIEEVIQEQPAYTLDQVRSKLTQLSRDGKAEQVKVLIQSFGVENLTKIPVMKYAEAMEKAEAL